MAVLNQGRLNLLLASSSLTISSAGSILLHIVFALKIYEQTQSGLLTSFFISLQWLPMLLVIIYRSDWEHGLNPRTRWYLLDGLCALLTLPILLFIPSTDYFAIVGLLFVRGIFDQINRINKTVAVKALFPKEKAIHYASFLQTGYHVGIGLAAVIGIFLIDNLDLMTVVWIDAATFVVSAGLLLCTTSINAVDFPRQVARSPFKKRIQEYMEALRSEPRLFFCAILPPATATFFQGTYSVLQPLFPIQGLGLGTAEVSISYILASIAIVAGSSGFSIFCKRYQLFERSFQQTIFLVVSLSFIAALSYVLSVWTQSPVVSAIFFTIMVLLFEFVWMNGYAGIVAFAPNGKLGSVFGISFSIGCLMASFIGMLVGLLLDMTENNFLLAVGTFMSIYLLIIFIGWSQYRKLMAPAETAVLSTLQEKEN
ncbi:MFS transporter [Algicola sagamiensis]|uniref:MFS transporter n=1 Tax=Algicola sagamiensis TaxID=163869 RepID=UPI000371DD4F|nr:MFS transporter [Algicola sagamiensis]